MNAPTPSPIRQRQLAEAERKRKAAYHAYLRDCSRKNLAIVLALTSFPHTEAA